MKTTKTYKTKIGAKFAILKARIKNFFNGSHYVTETFTTKFDTENNVYELEHYTMTREEERKFHELIAENEAKIVEMANARVKETKTKEEKWAEDVERNRQKQLAQNKSKKSNPSMSAKPKRKYNKQKKEQTQNG